ncbi:MAG TPA: helix-turn-helix domain-containing protein [Chloroflexota bacterium]|nr:helix-turn-helix domain-containing protein [Chloroflexota bacterium]
MADSRDSEHDEGAFRDPVEPMRYVDAGPHVGFSSPEEFEDRVRLEVHVHANRHTHDHISLSQEEYTPQEVAWLVGSSLEVVMHAIWNGDLKAERRGRDVICIRHEDVTDWLKRRSH